MYQDLLTQNWKFKNLDINWHKLSKLWIKHIIIELKKEFNFDVVAGVLGGLP